MKIKEIQFPFSEVFSYKTLRTMIGVIVIALPFIVTNFFSNQIPSISASYYTNKRDIFVGVLFFISAFLWAYNGHNLLQSVLSKIAAVAAIMVALFPTACETCETTTISQIHYVSAGIVLLILAYFCFFPFGRRAFEKGEEGRRRGIIYMVCGAAIVVSLGYMFYSFLRLPSGEIHARGIVYWGETVSLLAFGTSWLVAGQVKFSDIRDRLKSRFESVS